MDRIALPRGELEYRLIPAPAPGRPTVVLLHEGLASAALWRDVPDELARRTGCAVLNYSRYGYGGSAIRPLPWAKTYMHDEAIQVLPALLARLRIDRYVLVGHSDGGSIALIHGGGTAAHGLAGIVTLAAHVFTEPVGQASIAAAGKAYREGTLRKRLARWHDNVDVCFHGWHDSWLNPAFADWNVECYLPGIRVPVLAIQGTEDEYGTARQVEAIAAGCGAEALMLENCGHIVHRDQHETMLDAVAGFVARLG